MRRLACVIAARPNLVKMAPILRAMARHAPEIDCDLLHTGQHYDADMNEQHFQALGLPAPAVTLNVGSASHTAQTAAVMLGFESYVRERRPHAVLVVGDVNSSLACALVAAKEKLPLVHVESGLRSFDRAMPEEINRILTDQLAGLHFTTESSAQENLLREGIDPARIHFVGNVMVDSLHHCLPQAPDFSMLGPYGLVTLHRPTNVDTPDQLAPLVHALRELSRRLPLVFPVHPRTRPALAGMDTRGIHLLPPQSYLHMLGLMKHARLVLTDSGGVQEETSALGIACLTLRENTERPITVALGSNTIAGRDPDTIVALARGILDGRGKPASVPPLWDGKAAERIAQVLGRWLPAQG